MVGKSALPVSYDGLMEQGPTRALRRVVPATDEGRIKAAPAFCVGVLGQTHLGIAALPERVVIV